MVLLTNKEKFFNEYKKNLMKVRLEKPDLYSWPLDQFEIVYDRMIKAFEKQSFNKDSEAIKITCKTFKIKHTYQEIKKFLES